ncbi:LysM peptidoglycan-binding domain-containing protein [Candidatus Poriferisocius sp.]|uniref:LysM peptidoglycan-binding domain-containing protein n=1 Tax=Candidatus Poriferisocius sp. TaxID=3101276 RepID=UPI003B01FD2C
MNPNEEHRTELIRGLTSAALLAGLLIAIPTLLVLWVGWPLPRGVPLSSEATTAIRTGTIPSSLVFKSISLLIWIVWLQVLTGVIVELWAHFHGRVAPRVVLIPQFVQSSSARMIGTALLIAFSIQHPAIAVADNQDLLTPTAIEMDIEPPQSLTPNSLDSLSASDNGGNGSDAAPNVGPTEEEPLIHTVNQRDSLRSLAEQYLGDPDKWTEAYVLNHSQAQAVGGSLADPTRLQPGWELVMPADARSPELNDLKHVVPSASNSQADNYSTESDNTKITVKTGDTLRQLAAYHLNDPEKWIDIYNANQELIQNPNVIMAGWELQLPVDNPEVDFPLFTPQLLEQFTEASEASMDQAMPVVAYATTKPAVVASVALPSADGQSTPTTRTMFTIGGLGLFASSLGWTLARLRRMHRRHLPNWRMPGSPTWDAVQLEQQLEATSDTESALFLDASLRVMSSRMAGHSPPEVIGAILDVDTVSVLLATPTEAPSGFNASEDNMIWKLPKNEVLEHLMKETEGVPAPLPTLVAVGKKAGGEFLLNLEHMTALDLQGNPEAVENLCAAMAIQLANSHLADDLTVLCVGFGQDLRVFERVEYVSDVTAAIERIALQQRQNRALLGSCPSAADTRIGNRGDHWHPTVVLVPGQLTKEEAYRLLEVCGSSICVVAHGLNGATWLGRFDEHGLFVEPLGIRLEPHGMSGAAVAAVSELAADAVQTHGVELEVPLAPIPTDLEITPGFEQELTEVEVRVLGSVEVLGAAQPFASRRALDLVAYLAFHPEGADRDQLRAHLWPPDDPPSESTLANTISRARKALGVNEEGRPYLPRVTPKGTYRLLPEVGTDVARFEALVSAARVDAGNRGRQRLQAALELVRGTPFTGGTGNMYRWADFGLRTQIECMVDTAAHESAKLSLEVGDSEGARRAVMTSLRLVGVCEQCYRWRLMAAAENPTEVRQIMAELVELLKRESAQHEVDDLISPDLLELYDQLMSSRSLFN